MKKRCPRPSFNTRERIRKRIVIYLHTQAIAIAQDFAYHTAARTHTHTHKPMYPKSAIASVL